LFIVEPFQAIEHVGTRQITRCVGASVDALDFPSDTSRSSSHLISVSGESEKVQSSKNPHSSRPLAPLTQNGSASGETPARPAAKSAAGLSEIRKRTPE
jgi:hypothetical protein